MKYIFMFKCFSVIIVCRWEYFNESIIFFNLKHRIYILSVSRYLVGNILWNEIRSNIIELLKNDSEHGMCRHTLKSLKFYPK